MTGVSGRHVPYTIQPVPRLAVKMHNRNHVDDFVPPSVNDAERKPRQQNPAASTVYYLSDFRMCLDEAEYRIQLIEELGSKSVTAIVVVNGRVEHLRPCQRMMDYLLHLNFSRISRIASSAGMPCTLPETSSS